MQNEDNINRIVRKGILFPDGRLKKKKVCKTN